MVFAKIKQNEDKVIVRFKGFPKDDEECVAYLKLMDEVYDKKKKFVILYDARQIGWLSLKHIKMQAAFMREKEHLTRQFMISAAIVLNSFAAKTVVGTLLKVRKPAAPCEIFTSVEDAKNFLRRSRNLKEKSSIVAQDESLNIEEKSMKDLEKEYNKAQQKN
jgi:hypothetical protein